MHEGKWNIEINELHLHNSQRITGDEEWHEIDKQPNFDYKELYVHDDR